MPKFHFPLPFRKKLTPDMILGCEELVEDLDEIYKRRAEVRGYALVFVDEKGVTHRFYKGNMSDLVFGLEQLKTEILNMSTEEE